MQPLVVAAASVNQTPLDWDGNEANLRAALERARAGGAQLVCFPELCISGYGAEDAFSWPNTLEQSLSVLERLLPDTRGLVVALGLPLAFEDRLFNAVALVVDGAVVGVAAKRHLAGSGLHYEPRWFMPWPSGKTAVVSLFGSSVPFGDFVFEVGGVRLGFEICEDAWVVERPGFELKQVGVDLILNPSASHFAFGKHEVRRGLVLAGARKCGAAYLYVNLLGNEAGRAIYDGDALLATRGEIQIEAARFSFAAHNVTWGLVDVDAERLERSQAGPEVVAPFESGARPVIVTDFDWTRRRSEPAVARWFDPAVSKEEAFAKTIALGLFDYLRKTRSRGFVVSLSGGCDSAACAVLVRLMVRLATLELGLGGLARSLEPTFRGVVPASEEEATRALLMTAYQSTDNSGEVTRSAARGLARALGAEHFEWDVQEFVDGYRERVEDALARPLSWETDDVALQNIQARVRAPSVWMLANVRGALLISTSNRSEAAVGYATMDGDTAGGLSPLAGIDKAYLRKWLVHVEKYGVAGLEPLAALAAINEQAPTAELRPAARAQTDEGDLMPYDVLDVAERAAIVGRLSPQRVLDVLSARFPEYSRDELIVWTKRFFRLFARNQWKRERYAPSFHVDDANLDPKTWCRFPILSGGFERELNELS